MNSEFEPHELHGSVFSPPRPSGTITQRNMRAWSALLKGIRRCASAKCLPFKRAEAGHVALVAARGPCGARPVSSRRGGTAARGHPSRLALADSIISAALCRRCLRFRVGLGGLWDSCGPENRPKKGKRKKNGLSTQRLPLVMEAHTSSVRVLSAGVNMGMGFAKLVGRAGVKRAPPGPGLLRWQSGVGRDRFFPGGGPGSASRVRQKEIQTDPPRRSILRYGRFSAHVPPQARGFPASGGTPKVRNSGSRQPKFGLDLNNDKSPELPCFQKASVEIGTRRKGRCWTLTTGNVAAEAGAAEFPRSRSGQRGRRSPSAHEP